MKHRQIIIMAIVALLTLAATPLRAQYFDWVRTYQSTVGSGTGSPDDDNMVLEMDADSKGNIYFIGRCVRGAEINGEELLYEVNHYNPSHNHYSLCIVKMSPRGEMVWHKAISEWVGHISSGHIQVVGDSAVACFVSYPRPWDVYHPAYWLDSLVQFPNWFVPTDSISSNGGTALVILDLDGHLKEQHFLNVGYLDTLGVPIVSGSTPSSIVAPLGLGAESFCIDHEGNIILGMGCGTEKGYRTIPCDTCDVPWQSEMYSVENGGVGAVRIMVDGTRSLFYYPENRPILTNAKLLKFSPHFDTLLEVRYLMQQRLDSPRTWGIDRGIIDSKIMHVTSDPEGNLYAVGFISVYNTLDTIVTIDSLQGLSLHLSGKETSFLIKYTPQLQPIYAKQLDGGWASGFDHCVVKDSSLFVAGGHGPIDSNYRYDGEPLTDINQGTLLLRLNKGDGSLISYGKSSSSRDNGSWPSSSADGGAKIAVGNNRVARQVKFLGNIVFAGDTIRVPESPYWGRGVALWDYDGHQLTFINLHAPNPDNRERGGLFSDSSLYLCGLFIGEITFGDTSFYRLHSNGYVARYVDTAFLRPYVHPTPVAIPPVNTDGGECPFTLSPNPTTGTVRVSIHTPSPLRGTPPNLGGEPGTCSLTVRDAAGHEVMYKVIPPVQTAVDLDLSRLPAGAYFVTLSTPASSATQRLVLK